MSLRIFKVNATLHGILIFSSEVRPLISSDINSGSYIATSPYIHNYPLMYGLLNKPSESYFVVPSLHYWYYEERKSIVKRGLRYSTVREMIEKFKKGEEGSFYIFPLLPKEFSVTSFLLSSESWTYAPLVRGRTKNMFPRLTSYSALSPGSEFTTFIATRGEVNLPRYIRIGKKRFGLLKLNYEEIKVENIVKKNDQTTSIPVNSVDVRTFGFRIASFSRVLETPNIDEGEIGWAKLDECTVIISGGEELCLPLP